jgi:aminomethyltransferase
MKQTPFLEKHLGLGAKMAAYAGFNMPISYSGIVDEHQTVRNTAGVFDVSHMGEFIVKGDKALDLIQRITTNDASRLKDGQVQYSCMTNDQGGIIDDLLVYCLEENKVYMLVVNAANIEKDWNWISSHNTEQAELHNISERTALLAVQGPLATAILQPLTGLDLHNLKYYHFVKGTFAGVDDVIVSATGYTGAGGVEIYFKVPPFDSDEKDPTAGKIWDAIFEAGADKGLKPAGLAARDTLRLEMGFCLYGNDIDDTTSPLEAGLGWITKFTKPFTASDILKQQKADGLHRRLTGFELLDKGIPRHGYEIFDESGTLIGHVTSGTQSPSLGKAIGLGYIQTGFNAIGSSVFIKVRDKLLRGTVVKLPFD